MNKPPVDMQEARRFYLLLTLLLVANVVVPLVILFYPWPPLR